MRNTFSVGVHKSQIELVIFSHGLIAPAANREYRLARYALATAVGSEVDAGTQISRIPQPDVRVALPQGVGIA